jgi:hypothetical protein
MNYFLSGEDIKELLGDIKIVRFSELNDYSSLEELLQPNTCVVIFWETQSYNNGHWTALMRYDDYYEYFDSYGLSESEDFALVPKHMKKELKERDYLKTLFTGNKVVQNTFDYQQWKDGVNTCGRWVVLRLYLFQRGYNLKQFHKIIMSRMKQNKFKSYDELSVYYTK